MLENVPQLANTRVFRELRKQLSLAGSVDRVEVLDVAKFGVPQRRLRMIYVASLDGPIELGTPAAEKVTVYDSIGSLPLAGSSGDPIHDLPEKRSERVRAILSALPKDGGSRRSLPDDLKLACHTRSNGFNDVYGRMRWNDVAPTITSGCTNPSKGRFVHPEFDRAITLREGAMLQGFPQHYRFDPTHGKGAIALMIGNALPPPFIAAHAKTIRRHIHSYGRK
jgi:DNA (cytosine-5)-methyltransferase 1